MTSKNSKQSGLFMKLNSRIENHVRSCEDTKCVEADGQYSSNTHTPKSGNENQPAEDNSKPLQSESVDSLKAKEEELKKDIFSLSSLMKKNAESCLRLKEENNHLMQELKKILHKDEISKLEAMNPDANSQPLDDNNGKHCHTSPEPSGESNPSTDDEGDSDSLTPMQMERNERILSPHDL